MTYLTQIHAARVNRRAAITGTSLSVAALGLTGLHATAAQNTTAEIAKHPIVGTWFSVTPLGPAISIYGADGAMTVVFAPTQAGQLGTTYHSASLGSWEPISERAIRFTMIQVMSDAAGTYLGTATIEGFPTVAEDGQTFVDASPESKITIRDAANAQVAVVGGDGSTPPVTSVRVRPGDFSFPVETPTSGTPTS